MALQLVVKVLISVVHPVGNVQRGEHSGGNESIEFLSLDFEVTVGVMGGVGRQALKELAQILNGRVRFRAEGPSVPNSLWAAQAGSLSSCLAKEGFDRSGPDFLVVPFLFLKPGKALLPWQSCRGRLGLHEEGASITQGPGNPGLWLKILLGGDVRRTEEFLVNILVLGL